MVLKYHKKLFIFLIIVIGVVLAVGAGAQCQYHNVYGWAWSENIGWISMACGNRAHWALVDDVVPDDATYVWTDSATEQKDAYELENAPVGMTRNINGIRVKQRYLGTTTSGLRLNGVESSFPGSSSAAGTWADRTTSWEPNRPGGGSWTWNDINDLQVVTGLSEFTSPGFPPFIPPFTQQGKLTQIYIEVDYDGGILTLRPNGDGDYTNIEGPPDGGIDYGVDIDSATGEFSDYAWSENIGWISFEPADVNVADCPDWPASCQAVLDLNSLEVSGWARALAYGDGWDGWIKMKGTTQDGSPYGVTLNPVPSPSEFEGWAWGDEVVGWVSFNCSNTGVCATSDYKVITDISVNNPPTATDLNITEGDYCFKAAPPIFLSWTFDDPGDTQSAYQIQIDNNSNFNSPEVDSGKVSSSSQTYAPINLSFGTQYWWRLKVWDSQDRSSVDWIYPASSFTTDSRWPWPDFTWDPLEPIAGEDVTFTNNTDFCAACSYEWDFDDGSPLDNSENPVHAFMVEDIYSVTLRSTSGTHSCVTSDNVAVEVILPLPVWKEIAPF